MRSDNSLPFSSFRLDARSNVRCSLVAEDTSNVLFHIEAQSELLVLDLLTLVQTPALRELGTRFDDQVNLTFIWAVLRGRTNAPTRMSRRPRYEDVLAEVPTLVKCCSLLEVSLASLQCQYRLCQRRGCGIIRRHEGQTLASQFVHNVAIPLIVPDMDQHILGGMGTRHCLEQGCTASFQASDNSDAPVEESASDCSIARNLPSDTSIFGACTKVQDVVFLFFWSKDGVHALPGSDGILKLAALKKPHLVGAHFTNVQVKSCSLLEFFPGVVGAEHFNAVLCALPGDPKIHISDEAL
mmetsp:Transcript_71777/g.149956  ORF Transcript_71777/g.149956 Transcript_71777/m.149956 type:complete len:297 (+) Transcript_71777:337-1227(+)